MLCGELELPFGLIGFVTDYANEVVPGEPTPVATMGELMGEEHGDVRRCAARGAWPGSPDAAPRPAGTVYRLGTA